MKVKIEFIKENFPEGDLGYEMIEECNNDFENILETLFLISKHAKE